MFLASGTNLYLSVCCAEGGSGGIGQGHTSPVPGGTGPPLKVSGGTPAKPRVKLSTFLDPERRLPFPLAGSGRIAAQRAASQTGSGGVRRGPVNCPPKIPPSFRWLYGTRECLTLPAQTCITAHGKTPEPAIWATPE